MQRYGLTQYHTDDGRAWGDLIKSDTGEYIKFEDYEAERSAMSLNAMLGDLTALQEELAAFAHSQWSGWMEYLFSKCHIVHLEPTLSDPDGELCLVIPKWAVDRWKRQIQTDYKKLSEDEKNSDRKEAAAVIDIIHRNFTQHQRHR